MAHESFNVGLNQLGVSQPIPFIGGSLLVENAPAKKRFFAIDRLSGKIIASGKSKPDGTFKKYVPESYNNNKKLFVISFDDTAVYNAEVADHINATPW